MFKKFLFLLIILSLFSGCYTAKFYATNGDVRMTSSKKGKVVDKFSASKSIAFFVEGLFPKQSINISEVLATEGVKNAANVTLNYKSTFIDILLSGITLGIYTPKTVIIEGNRVEK